MELQKLSRKQIFDIYSEYAPYDFSSDEIKPISVILNLFDAGFYFGLGLFDENRLLGYALFCSNDKTRLLLDYFAVIAENRCQGVGSLFLQHIKNYLSDFDEIILEVEDIKASKDKKDREIRLKRIDFYIKNGAVMTNIKSKIFNVEFSIMSIPLKAENQDEKIKKSVCDIYHIMLPDEIYDKNVFIY